MRVILRVVDGLEIVLTEAGPTLPLGQVRGWVASNPLAFQGAEAWLRS